VKLFNFNKRKAQKFHKQGEKLSDEGNDQEAIDCYMKAIEFDKEKSESYYNIGLVYKYQGEWEKSLKYNQIANQLDPNDEAARWNLAIAATALRKWDIARQAWKENGLPIGSETGPIEMNFGITPLRLNPDDSGEVVWGTRVDPVRARIDSIPYKDSGFKHGDIVLHDGAAVGYRKIEDSEFPVFNVLDIFEVSSYTTVIASVKVYSDEDLKILNEFFAETKHDFEDWTTNIKPICRQCSEGKPHEHHDKGLTNEWVVERTLGLALFEGASIDGLFEKWQKTTKGVLIGIEE
jgi:hypothetical protein